MSASPTRYVVPSFQERVAWWLRRPRAIALRLVGEVYKWRNPEAPWISHHALRFCEGELRPGMQGIEWGSGRSTAWFARRLGRLTSVEHDQGWYAIVQEKLRAQGVSNVDYRYVALNHPAHEPTHREYPRIPDYVAVASEFSDGSLDFAVVDGHYRQACIAAVMPKLRSGGLLLVDNSNWMALEHWGVPAAWPVVHRSEGYEGETTIWRKP